jgi:superfamily II DNA or RNA helicase
MSENINPLHYVLSALNSGQGLPKLGLQIFLKTDGKTPRLVALKNIFQTADQFSLADQKLIYWLKFIYQHQLVGEDAGSVVVLQGEVGAQILSILLASKCCYWLSVQNPPLTESGFREAHLEWELVGDGLKKLRCHLIGSQNIIFKLDPFWYLDQRTWQCGIVNISVSSDIVNKLLAAPAMTDAQIKSLYDALGQSSVVPRKNKSIKKSVEAIELLPQLNLCMLPICIENPYDSTKQVAIKIPAVELLFNYGGQIIPAMMTKKSERIFARDGQAEKQALHLMQEQGLINVRDSSLRPAIDIADHAYFILPEDHSSAWLDFNMKQLCFFRELKWQIVTASDYPCRVVDQSDIEWYTQLDEASNQKWFNVELGITIGGEKINLLPLLVMAIENFFAMQGGEVKHLSEEGYLLTKLPDGRLLPIPVARLKPILNVLTELFDRHNLNSQGKIRLSRVRAAQLFALEKVMQDQLKMRWWGADQLQALVKQLQGFSNIEAVEIPKGLNAELRFYQHEGLNWLQFLRTYHLGGILADDMGLGKTIQTLAHILLEKESGRMRHPCLVVTPTTLVTNWQLEAKKYCPNLRVLVLHGVTRQGLFKKIEHYDLVLTTYPLIVRDYEILEKNKFYLLVLDEAQIVKNARSKAALFVNKLNAEHRLCLTGTPLENHLGELWSLFNFLMPGLLGDNKEFVRIFRTPIEKHHQEDRRDILRQRLAPFVLRRTKQSVALELPEKNEIISTIQFEAQQSDLYESIRLSLHESIQLAIEKKGLASSQLIILDALLKLRQICCDPRLLKLDSVQKANAGSAKLQYLCDTLPDMIEEGRKILLFSQFAEMLSLIEIELIRLKIPYAILTGQTQDRQKPINAFQNGEVPLFLISLKAGGLGLNLTAADTVIHYDPWWNPAVERQATDRAHRIGQEKSVFVYKLIMEGSIEEKILLLQQKKQNLLEILHVDYQSGTKNITVEDLQKILSYTETI